MKQRFFLKVLKSHCSRCSNKDKELIQLKDFISSSSCSTSSSTTSSYLWLVWLALGLAALAACVLALFKYKSKWLFLCFSCKTTTNTFFYRTRILERKITERATSRYKTFSIKDELSPYRQQLQKNNRNSAESLSSNSPPSFIVPKSLPLNKQTVGTELFKSINQIIFSPVSSCPAACFRSGWSP